MNIARIVDGRVVNIEVGTQAWLDEQVLDERTLLVPYSDDEHVSIGDTYDAAVGFPLADRPPVPVLGDPPE